MNDPPISISSAPSVDPEGVAAREFPTARRGYDQSSVRRFLSDVGQQMRAWRSREAELLSRLSDAERRAEAPLIDEETVSAAVGSETARILHAAHSAGTEVLAKAEARAAQVLAEAEQNGRELHHRAEAEASTIVAEARQAAASTLEAARSEGRMMVDEAREVRRRILADLAERRRVLSGQIEQLRAGKDTLSSAVSHVAEAIAEVRSRLEGSDDDARAAAETALRRSDAEYGAPAPSETRDEEQEAESQSAPMVTIGGTEVKTAGDATAVEEPPAPASSTGAPNGVEGDADTHDPELVGELFAKLRAAAPTVETNRPHRTRRRRNPTESAPSAAPTAEQGPLDEAVLTGLVAEAAIVEEEAVASTARTAILTRREELVGPAKDEVVHALKRALRVEQNELLDRLRSLPRGADPLTALPVEKAASELAEATRAGLVVAFDAGTRFAEERIGSNGNGTGPPRDPVVAHATAEAVASGLGTEVAAAIVRRLDEGIHGVSTEGGSLQHAVGAAYREWKGERVEDVAADHVTAAFAQGALDAAKRAGSRVVWIADDGTSRCSDCEDDELAGALVAGTAFPTGQTHPPAHGGCRCVLAPPGF